MYARSQTRRPLALRAGAITAILGLHVAAFCGLAQVRARHELVKAVEPVEVIFIDEARALAPQSPGAQLAKVDLPQMTLPGIDLPLEIAPSAPAPVAITQVAAAVQSVSPPVSDEPVAVERPDYVRQCDLKYPPMARRMNAHGTAIVRVLVDTQGRPREVEIERSSGNRLLDASARECALQTLFRPLREGGRLRNSVVTIPIEFIAGVRTASR
jgi:protein TonB